MRASGVAMALGGTITNRNDQDVFLFRLQDYSHTYRNKYLMGYRQLHLFLLISG